MREEVMTDSIYTKLREQMDQYSIGFPETESGIEMKILKKLFTEEEAAMYLDLSLMLESPESVAQRTGRDLEKTAGMLQTMTEKGLLFCLKRNGTASYAVVPFVIGSYEFQLGKMDKEFAQMTEQYFEEAFLTAFGESTVLPLRTIPVNKSVDVTMPVAPYRDAKAIIKTKDKIAVAECICRVQQGLVDKGCGKPKEVCLVFGSHADYYLENNMARLIDQDEAIAILEKSEEAGLVNQPANMVNPGGMCNCCGDCCGLLRALNKFPKPADLVYNIYFAAVDSELCTGCETCIERCQVGAIEIDDDVAQINLDRCIGCGLCVTTCPTEAMRLDLKPEEDRQMPPASGQEFMMKNAEKRGTSLMPLGMSEK
jgi:H+/Na+-translocating ferredoxin:NAD+ oxidoreductase subunit B